MLKGIGVNNFRSFDKEQYLEIKPITIFVGKNSSGKSSLIRTFPLFRQSSEENTTGPVLWYGRYVDFGDFSDVISKNTTNDTIGFNFEILLTQKHMMSVRSRKILSHDDTPVKIKLELSSGKDKKTRTKKVTVVFFDEEYSIVVDEQNNANIFFLNQNISFPSDNYIVRNTGNFLPTLSLKKREEANMQAALFPKELMWSSPFREDPYEASFYDSAVKNLRPYFHYNTSNLKIRDGLKAIGPVSKNLFIQVLKYKFKEQKHFLKNLKTFETEILQKVYPLSIMWNINYLNSLINISLNETYRSVRYIAPLRATSERFYRFQDLQVHEIDHTGSNLAMLLNSLRPQEKANFEAWTKENFGFYVKVKQVGAHFAVNIQMAGSDNEFNVSDMGFGYSQVLPIIAAIWIESENKNNSKKNNPILFIIEQPELHLHPAYQHNLAKLFAKVVKKTENVKIIFETHSQSMIEALSECIEDSSHPISKDDVSIIVFNKDEKNSTTLQNAYFDENGYLNNWPIGFFSGMN